MQSHVPEKGLEALEIRSTGGRTPWEEPIITESTRGNMSLEQAMLINNMDIPEESIQELGESYNHESGEYSTDEEGEIILQPPNNILEKVPLLSQLIL